MKLKDTNTSVTESAHRSNNKEKTNSGRKCFFCDKPGHIKVKCYKWLTTNEGKQYTKDNLSDNDSDNDGNKDEAKQASQGRKRRRNNPANNKKSGSARAAQKYENDDDNVWMAKKLMGLNPATAWITGSGLVNA